MIEWIGDRVRARVALLPLGTALVVCDRLDAAIAPDLVCWPDDSSHHLASAIPSGRRADWLDLGCGSAFAPLSRPELAARITAIDLNPRAVRFAEIGAALSGIPRLAAATGDIADPQPQAELVTCNAPMPAHAHDQLRGALPEIWRHADPGFFDRLWPAVRQAVRPGGLIVVHAASDVVLPALSSAGGERVVVRYTPEGAPGFAVAWWRPDAEDRMVVTHRVLTAARPHLDPRDRDDALAPPP